MGSTPQSFYSVAWNTILTAHARTVFILSNDSKVATAAAPPPTTIHEPARPQGGAATASKSLNPKP